MQSTRLFFSVLLAWSASVAQAAGDFTDREWAMAETVCSALVLRAQRLAGDPDHKRITSPLNRVMAIKETRRIRKIRNEGTAPPLPQGTPLQKGDTIAGMADYEKAQLDQAIDRLRQTGGRVIRISGTSLFTVLDDGSPVLFLSEHYVPHTLAHELAHLEHYLEIRAVLEKEGLAELEAAQLSSSLMSTPEGLWLTEQRATQAQYLSAVAQGFAPQVAGRELYRAHEATIQANYPALAALRRTIEMVVELDREPPGDPQVLQIHALIRNKLLTDLTFYIDVTVENTLQEWNRQIAQGSLPAGSYPQTFAAFFGRQNEVPPEQKEFSDWVQGVILDYLLQSLNRYQEAQRSVGFTATTQRSQPAP